MSFAPTATTVLNPWVRIQGALEVKVNRQSYSTWLKPTRFSHVNGRVLFVRIPSAQFEHIGERYGDLIREAIDNMGLDLDEVKFVTAESDPAVPRMAVLHRPARTRPTHRSTSRTLAHKAAASRTWHSPRRLVSPHPWQGALGLIVLRRSPCRKRSSPALTGTAPPS